jgi:DNA-binding PadR family transcriptional regulator
MSYEFLVLHALKNNESATPEQITKLLKTDMYWFVDGNGVRVTLKRLKDKGLVVRSENGSFSITSDGVQYYKNLSKSILGELSPTEKILFEFLQTETKGYNEFVAFPLESIAKKLNIPFKTCLNAGMRLACKRKVLLGFQQKSKNYQISLSFTEYAKLRECMQA